jgi:mRNA-degrading endonuclease HigB of HigAB toxin-antitoxin module
MKNTTATNNTIAYPVLTAKERESILNFGNVTNRRETAELKVLKIFNLPENKRFATLKKVKSAYGTIRFVVRENKWYFEATDGETYRLNEPKDGIESRFKIEFKRKKAKEEKA